jgi:hypothetical protein
MTPPLLGWRAVGAGVFVVAAPLVAADFGAAAGAAVGAAGVSGAHAASSGNAANPPMRTRNARRLMPSRRSTADADRTVLCWV